MDLGPLELAALAAIGLAVFVLLLFYAAARLSGMPLNFVSRIRDNVAEAALLAPLLVLLGIALAALARTMVEVLGAL